MKRGDLVRTNPESWSYKVWTGVVLQVMSDGLWALVRSTEPDEETGRWEQWIPVAELKVVKVAQ